MSKTTILYKDVAPGADEDAAVSVSAAAADSDIAALPFGITPEPAITGELNQWGLNGQYRFPDRFAFWSAEQSGDDCSFRDPPVITVEFDAQYTSTGVMLIFDGASDNYCASVNMKWYQGGALKADADFAPDSAAYFCSRLVESYDKVVITLESTHLPGRRARLNQIAFGIYRAFGMDEIRSASIISEVSLSALESPICTLSWTLDSRDEIEYMFQMKQPIEVRSDNSPIGVFYIDASRRNGMNVYTVECSDAFGTLDETKFTGGVYAGKSAKALLTEIINGDFKVVFDGVADMALTGLIMPCSKREAIQQVLFAWGVLAASDGSGTIRIFGLPQTAKEVGTDRTYTGVSTTTSSIVTEVRVTAHTYTQAADGGIEIGGVKYSDTETVYTVANPNATANDKQNVKEVTGATLVSPSIGQAVAQRVYDYYAKRNTHEGKIIWQGERLGDLLTMPNAWGSTSTGHIQRMEIALSNTIVASCEILGA